jgi:hypothetical protein
MSAKKVLARLPISKLILFLLLLLAIPSAVYLATNIQNIWPEAVFNSSQTTYRHMSSGELTKPKNLFNLAYLPYFRENLVSKMVSSFDRTGGNNDGHIDSVNSKLAIIETRGETEYVIFNSPGCGVITRFFTTGHTPLLRHSRINFYFGKNNQLDYSTNLVNFFTGHNAPFIKPLVSDHNDSKGAYNSYLPIYYDNGLMITTSNELLYYQLNYQELKNEKCPWRQTDLTQPDYMSAANELLKSYEDYLENPNPWNIRDQATLDDPSNQYHDWAGKLTTSPAGGDKAYPFAEKPLSLNSNQSGTITSLRLRVMDDNRSIRNNLWLRIYWDNLKEPYINAPLGHLFGSNLDTGQKEHNTLLLGSVITAEYTDYYLFFPMPFLDQARMEIVDTRAANSQPVDVYYKVRYVTHAGEIPLGSEIGYFRTHWRQETVTGSKENYSVLNIGRDLPPGKGQYVGTLATFSGYKGSYGFLEGDELIQVDHGTTHYSALRGTGTEDYFGGGYYFNSNFPNCEWFVHCYDRSGLDPSNRQEIKKCIEQNQARFQPECRGEVETFNQPLFGLNAAANIPAGMNSLSMYRLHIPDLIPFNQTLDVSFEHGDVNNGEQDNASIYRSVALFYYYPH